MEQFQFVFDFTPVIDRLNAILVFGAAIALLAAVAVAQLVEIEWRLKCQNEYLFAPQDDAGLDRNTAALEALTARMTAREKAPPPQPDPRGGPITAYEEAVRWNE